MANMTLTLGDLIDEALANMYRGAERPRQITITASALDDTSDTSLTVSNPEMIPPTTILETPDGEMLLVSAVSDDATPVVTVSRAYNNTTAASGQITGTVLLIEPRWGRAEVTRWLKRWFQGPGNTYFPVITSGTKNRATGLQYVEMPADAMRVLRVRHYSTLSGRIVDIAGWQFEQRIPTAVVSTGQALRVPSTIWDEDDLIVEWTEPYAWSDATEAATIDIPVGADDLPVIYAAAYGIARREITRVELDKVVEWNQEQAARAGINLRLLRDMWGEYYRRIDEARKIQDVPKHRPYRKRAKVT